jgi:hypothetical protein
LGNGHPHCRAPFAVPVREEEDERQGTVVVESVSEAGAAAPVNLGAEP